MSLHQENNCTLGLVFSTCINSPFIKSYSSVLYKVPKRRHSRFFKAMFHCVLGGGEGDYPTYTAVRKIEERSENHCVFTPKGNEDRVNLLIQHKSSENEGGTIA